MFQMLRLLSLPKKMIRQGKLKPQSKRFIYQINKCVAWIIWRKKKSVRILYGGMIDTDFVVVCEFMPNGNIAWNAQAFGSFGGVYRSTLNGVHLLKRPSGEHSIFLKDLVKDLETNFKLASCRLFSSGGQMPWGHSEDKN